MITFFAFILVFGILVFVHELGHFLMARRLGVRVEEFGFGFPPRLWSRKKGDTLYSFNLIPLGGFVRMYGEHGEDKNDPKSYASKTKTQKILILISGVLMNFLLTVAVLTVIFTIGFKAAMIPIDKEIFGIQSDQKVEVVRVEENTPAFNTLKTGDIIKQIEGKEITIDSEVFIKVNEVTKDDPGRSINIVIIRDGEEEQKSLNTYETEIENRNKKLKVRRLGVIVETKGSTKFPFYVAPFAAFLASIKWSFEIAKLILSFFSKIIFSFSLDENVVGLVGIAILSGWSIKAGLIMFLQFIASISISLAVINLMPIPALDGGHIFTLLLEKIRGKDFSPSAKNGVQFIGFVLLILLMIAITARDLVNFGIIQYMKNLF